MRGNDMHLISFFQNKISIRNIDLFSSFYCTYQDFNLELPVYFRKRKPCKCTVLPYDKFYQFYTSLHECLYFTCLREKQYSGYLICRRTFRINRHTQMKILFQQIDLSVIDWISYTCDRMSGTQSLSQQTAQHVKFICGCTGNHKIRMRYIRLSLHLYICSISCNTENIKFIHCFF